METKEIIKYAAIAVGAYFVYTYVIAPLLNPSSASASTLPPANTGANTTTNTNASGQQGSNAPPPANNQTQQQTPPPPAGVVDNTFGSSDYGTDAWIARVSNAMTTAAGGNGRDLDTWSWYYQNPVKGSTISAALMQGIIDGPGGGDRTKNIYATDFVKGLIAAKASGLSGYSSGMGNFGLGTFWRIQ